MEQKNFNYQLFNIFTLLNFLYRQELEVKPSRLLPADKRTINWTKPSNLNYIFDAIVAFLVLVINWAYVQLL